MEVLLGCVAAVLNLARSLISRCKLSNPGEQLLLTRRSAEKRTAHNDFLVKDGGSPGYLTTVTGEVSAHISFSPGCSLYVHSRGTRKTLWREALLMVEVEVTLISVSVSPGYAQRAVGECLGKHHSLHQS